MIQILGWTILHSLWQIALIASIYLLLKSSWRGATALKKYYLAVTSLVATFLSTTFTFGYLFKQNYKLVSTVSDSTLIPITNEIPTTNLIPITPNEIVVETTLSFTDYLTICLPYLVAFWGMGLLYFTIRFLKNLYGVQQLQSGDNEIISNEWLTKIATFKTQLNIQKEVQVFLSLHVKEPITFGHFKPIILLPISLVTGFDTAAIETILLHELAHIKRHDYLVNLGQSIIEIILFYHPLVWWLSKDIRELREHCCDDLVLSLGDNRITYVETLTALQWRKVGGVTNRLSMSASGGEAGFTRRIKRMFGVEEERGSFRQLMGMFLVLLVFAVGGMWVKNELSIPDKMSSDKIFVVHKNTTLSEIDELTQEMRDLGIYKSFCWSMDYDAITSINGAYYDAAGNVEYFDITDIQKTPTQFIFENGLITEISELSHQSIQLKSAKDASTLITNLLIKDGELKRKDDSYYTILINDKTTKEELTQWTKMVVDEGIYLDFDQTIFDEQGKVVELRGNYHSSEKEGNFFAANLPCVNVTFELYKDQLSEPIFSYPCREKSIGQVDVKSMSIDDLTDRPIKKEKGQIYWIDGKTFGNNTEKAIEELSALEIFDGFSFNPETNSFNGSYFYEKGKTNFIEVEDVAKRPIKIVIKNGYVAELKITGTAKDGIGYIRNEFLDKIPNWGQNNKDTLTYLVSNEMTRIELYEMIAKIKSHSQVQINLDPLKTKFDEQDKLVSISGKYYYERSTRTPIQTFEVADLRQFQLQLTSHPTITFAPAYYNIATRELIQVIDHYSAFQTFANKAILTGDPLTLTTPNTYKDIHATLTINKYTSVEDLKTFAEKILPNNIIFRYQDSEFKDNGTITKLVGNFLGDGRIGEPFFVDDLTKYQVRLKIKKGLVYQPEITSIVDKRLSFKTNDQLKRDYEIGLLQATNEKERIVWREKLANLEEMGEKFKAKSYINFKPSFLNEESKKETERSDLSYKITSDIDIAELKSILVKGQEIAGKDLPTFIKNHLPEAVKINIPKTKRYPKTDTSVDWLYWGDQKINLGAAYKKDEHGNLKWDAPKLQVSKEVWENNKDRPFIFQIDGNWHRVKDFDMIVLVPHKEDPMSVNFNKDYAKALRNKETSIFKLFAKIKEKNQLYFEKLDIGLPIKIFMMVEIIENNSTGFIPKTSELNEPPKKTEPVFAKVVGRKDLAIDTFKNWVQWDNLKFNFSATFKVGLDGKRKLQTPELEISYKDWKRLYEAPFTFYLDGTWFKVKTIKEIVLVPHKKDPTAVSLHQNYYQVIKDKNHRATKLLAEANVNDRLYFELIDVGKDFTFGMVVKIVETQPKHSTGYIDHINGLIHNAENPNNRDFQAPNFGDAKIPAEHVMRLSTEDGNTQNWIYWGEKKIEWGAIKVNKGFRIKQVQSKILLIQQKDWLTIFDKQMTLYYDGHYYNTPDFENIFLEKKGVLLKGAELAKPYNQEIQDKDNFIFRLLKNAKIGEQITFQKMRLRKNLFCDLIVKIIENQPTNSTGFIPKDAIHFDKKDALMSMSGYPPAYQHTALPDLKIDAFLPKDIPPTKGLMWSKIPPKKAPIYIINGVKYKDGWPEKISYDVIESMQVQMGLAAKTLYGEDEVYIITTKSSFGTQDSLSQPIKHTSH